MPRYFFEINGRRDEIGVDLESDEAAIRDSRLTVIKLAEFDCPAPEYGDEWTCVVYDERGRRLDCVTRYSRINAPYRLKTPRPVVGS